MGLVRGSPALRTPTYFCISVPRSNAILVHRSTLCTLHLAPCIIWMIAPRSNTAQRSAFQLIFTKIQLVLKYISKCVALIARSTAFLMIPTKAKIFHLESVRTVRSFISSPTSVKKSKIFAEKMKNENFGCIEKHVQMRGFYA